MQIVRASEIKKIDRIAIVERGIPALELIERAAKAVADACLGYMAEKATSTVAVFCGRGSNGADGIAVARLLIEKGHHVRAFMVGSRDQMSTQCCQLEEKLQVAGGTLENFEDITEIGAWCETCDLMVDAIYGVGLNADIQGNQAKAVAIMNHGEVPVVCVDIASGVEADTGNILGTSVEGTKTVTFTRPKLGHFVGKGGLNCGEITVVDIGIPEDLLTGLDDTLEVVFASDIHLPRRERDSYKGDYGKVYILGGSVGYSGAPVFAARSAVRTGSGLVHLGVPAPIWTIAASKLNESMCHPLPASKDGMLSLESTETVLNQIDSCDVCLVGPGLGRGSGVASVARHVMRNTHMPLVLDADGINALQGHIDILEGRRGAFTVLTPHEGEFERIGGDLSSGNRIEAARAYAAEHGCVVVLKGYRTIAAFPDGKAYINTTGNPGMAKGGSGDVLGGIIVSLLGQGLSARKAVPMAVYLHGLAGDVCAKEKGEYGMAPTDIVEVLPKVIKQFVSRH